MESDNKIYKNSVYPNKDISTSINRVDSEEKIGGTAKYLTDYEFDNMLYAKTLRSSKAHAKIKSITIPDLPQGYYIVDKNDVPGNNAVKIIFDDMPYFADEYVNYIGDPILLVVGEEKEKILNIMENIQVEYEELEGIFSIDEALKGNKKPIYNNDNVFIKYNFSKGKSEEIFNKAYKIIEGKYDTGYQEHIYLEPQGMIGVYDNGKISVYGSMQCPYYVKNALKQGLGFDDEHIQVIQTTTGGAFGGKEEYPSLIAGHAAFAAIKCEKPVQLIFDRNEDVQFTTKRHPSKIKIKAAVNEDYKIEGMDVDIILDGGAYIGLSGVILQRAMFACTGAYNIENINVKGRVVATNNVVSGAYRGFGAPQAYFALEMFINKIAREFNVEPLVVKKRNFIKQGDHTCTGGTFKDPVPIPELINKIEEVSEYSEKIKKYKNKQYKGIGLSIFYHGCGFTGSAEKDVIKAIVKLRKYKDNKVEILISNVEMGQGATTTLRKIAAYALNIDVEDVIYENPDTDRVPDSGPTVASRTIMIVGKLIQDAAEEMKAKWNSSESFEVSVQYKHPKGYCWDNEKLHGDAYNAYAWAVNVVEVEVNPITYEVDVIGIWTAFDIGKAIDEKIVYGQIDGGMIQGIGYGSIEVMNSQEGRLKQRSITDYIIPTSMDFPKVNRELVDNPYKLGPYGAKGLGEVSFVGAPVAFAAAVENAINKPIEKIPVTPEHIMEVMEK